MLRKIAVLFFLIVGVNCFPADDPDIENTILGEHLDEDNKDAIVGGEYTEIEAAPYLIQLYVRELAICGGSIVSKDLVISAAHCFVELRENGILTNDLSILTGVTVQGHGQRYKVLYYIMHENFKYPHFDNDIALIKVQGPIIFNAKQKPIEIANQAPKAGDVAQVFGFGKEGNQRAPSKILKTAYLSVLGDAGCVTSYPPGMVTKNMFCATAPYTSTCQGDSGGPVVVEGKLVGITSWGFKCASNRHPIVYTQLVNYKEWINQHSNLRL